MIYELRIYEAAPGKMGDLNRRFRDLTLGLFERHGMKVEWFATPAAGDWSDRLYYLMSFEDMADRDRKWAAFGADPDWQKGRAESERDGALVTRLNNIFLRPTGYSPGGR
jgi:hypothetical protein